MNMFRGEGKFCFNPNEKDHNIYINNDINKYFLHEMTRN